MNYSIFEIDDIEVVYWGNSFLGLPNICVIMECIPEKDLPHLKVTIGERFNPDACTLLYFDGSRYRTPLPESVYRVLMAWIDRNRIVLEDYYHNYRQDTKAFLDTLVD